MTQIVTRMFASQLVADDVTATLQKSRIVKEAIFVTGPEQGADEDAIAKEIMQGFVMKSHALVYAEKVVADGSVVVTVHAPFGMAARVIEILESYHPIDVGLNEETTPLLTWDDSAPFSSTLRFALLSNDPTPFSNFWGMPLLVDSLVSMSAYLRMPMLSDNPTPLSTSINAPILLNNPTPLSSMFKLPLLTNMKS